MFLAEIVYELKREVRSLSDLRIGGNEKISYDLKGKIIVEPENELRTTYDSNGSGGSSFKEERDCIKRIHFEGRLIYRVENGSGKIRFSPIKNPEARRDFIVAIIEGFTERNSYEFKYDEKEDKIIISSNRGLEEELERVAQVFGDPTRQEFEI